MFERTGSAQSALTFLFNGDPVSARQGDTVAAALLAAGYSSFRANPVSGLPRGPFCMMGACYDCLVSLNNETVQACMTPVTEGLQITSPPAPGPFGSNPA